MINILILKHISNQIIIFQNSWSVLLMGLRTLNPLFQKKDAYPLSPHNTIVNNIPNIFKNIFTVFLGGFNTNGTEELPNIFLYKLWIFLLDLLHTLFKMNSITFLKLY